MNSDLMNAAEALMKAESILIMTHTNPDGDAIGSAVACGRALKKLGKTVSYIVMEDKYGIDRFLPEMSYFGEELLPSYDCALAVDCSTREYAFGGKETDRCGMTVVIDHHKTNPFYGDVNYVDGSAAACGEIIYDLIEILGTGLDRESAHALYIALSTDTGNFLYSNTTSRTFAIVSELYRLYDDYYLIADAMKFCPREALVLTRTGLDSLLLSEDGSCAVIRLIYDLGYTDKMNVNSDALLDIVRYTEGIRVTVLIRQTGPRDFKISLRSTGDDTDVSILAGRMGGGGHEKAAGFNFEGSYSDLERIIREYFGF